MDMPDQPHQLFGAFVLAKAPAYSVISRIDASEALVRTWFRVVHYFHFCNNILIYHLSNDYPDCSMDDSSIVSEKLLKRLLAFKSFCDNELNVKTNFKINGKVHVKVNAKCIMCKSMSKSISKSITKLILKDQSPR